MLVERDVLKSMTLSPTARNLSQVHRAVPQLRETRAQFVCGAGWFQRRASHILVRPILGTDTSPGRPNRDFPCLEESENLKNIAKNSLSQKKKLFFLAGKILLIHRFPHSFRVWGCWGGSNTTHFGIFRVPGWILGGKSTDPCSCLFMLQEMRCCSKNVAVSRPKYHFGHVATVSLYHP